MRQKGSYKQFRHEDGRGTTVPFHKGRDISPRLLRQIASDIGLTVLTHFSHIKQVSVNRSPILRVDRSAQEEENTVLSI